MAVGFKRTQRKQKTICGTLTKGALTWHYNFKFTFIEYHNIADAAARYSIQDNEINNHQQLIKGEGREKKNLKAAAPFLCSFEVSRRREMRKNTRNLGIVIFSNLYIVWHLRVS